MLQELSNSHYNHVISFQEFRAKRREILNQIDEYYNGEPTEQGASDTVSEDTLNGTLSFGSYEAARDEEESSLLNNEQNNPNNENN